MIIKKLKYIKRCMLAYIHSLYSMNLRKRYINRMFFKKHGYSLDWNILETYSEKMQYEKLYNVYSQKIELTDKIAVRKYVKEKIGEDYLIPIIGIWEDEKSIAFKTLPNEFVLKTNNASGTNIIVTDKSKIKEKNIKKTIKQWLRLKFAYIYFEMHYSKIKPMVYAEKLIGHGENVKDYKFLCFAGKPYYCWVDTDRFSKHKRTVYDLNWQYVPVTIGPFKNDVVDKPINFDKMIELVTILCKGFQHVRIDLYNVEGKIYFGEMTFTSGAGFEKITPKEFDKHLGELWV